MPRDETQNWANSRGYFPCLGELRNEVDYFGPSWGWKFLPKRGSPASKEPLGGGIHLWGNGQETSPHVIGGNPKRMGFDEKPPVLESLGQLEGPILFGVTPPGFPKKGSK